MPFGHKDCLATIYLFSALNRAAGIEDAISRHPEWSIPAPESGSDRLRETAALLKSKGGEMFWNRDTGRFVGCIDTEGGAHDYGFTFLNLEAIHYGFATDSQARSILSWVDGTRTVGGDTSQGGDIYHWCCAPRATTRRNVDWYGRITHMRTLGMAHAPHPDGPWMVLDKPVLPIEEQIENSAIYHEKENGWWFLFTNHVGVDERHREWTDAIWVYWSKDPTKWDPQHKAVALDGKNCTWSRKCIGMPSVVPVDERLALFYDGPGGDSISHIQHPHRRRHRPLPHLL